MADKQLFSVVLNKQMTDDLKRIAQDRGMTKSQVVREWIKSTAKRLDKKES